MNLEEVMQQEKFVIVGNTLNKDKYAYIIKHKMLDKGYTVYSVDKELPSINDVADDIDIICLCINHHKGIDLLKEFNKTCKGVIIQPGAESQEIIEYLNEKNIPYLEGCLLVGLSLYK